MQKETQMKTETSITRNVKTVLLVILLLVAGLVGTMPRSAQAEPVEYTFTQIAALGDPAPGGGNVAFTFDFEPGDINNSGQLVFGADLTTGGEGVFLADSKGKISAIARTGDQAPAPDNAILGHLHLGVVTNNDHAGPVV